MAQVIQIKRRIPGVGKPAAGTGVGEVRAGELAASISAVAATAVADLYIGDGSFVHDLVSKERQVEVAGAQTITGAKTIAIGNLRVTGGADGDLVSTDGAGNLSFSAPARGVNYGTTAPTSPPPDDGDLWFDSDNDVLMVYHNGSWVPSVYVPAFSGVSANAPITGNGTSGTPLGLTVATNAQIETGTNNVFPITASGLRSEMGDEAANLTTTAKTVVPAINELDGAVYTLGQQLAAVSGALRFVGNYDADQSEVTTAATGTLTVGNNLPAAAAGNEGWYVIVVVDGTPAAPAPNVLMHTGDWIVSTGSQWIHVPLYHVATTAGSVGITTIGTETWTNVQQALNGIYTLANNAMDREVEVDDVSIVGDGVTTPLSVALVDGGTF